MDSHIDKGHVLGSGEGISVQSDLSVGNWFYPLDQVRVMVRLVCPVKKRMSCRQTVTAVVEEAEHNVVHLFLTQETDTFQTLFATIFEKGASVTLEGLTKGSAFRSTFCSDHQENTRPAAPSFHLFFPSGSDRRFV